MHTHLVSDHYHYWEEGGATYHTRYNTWEIVRGQEGDPWKGDLRPIDMPETVSGHEKIPGAGRTGSTASTCAREEDQPQAHTFADGLEFIRTNAQQDNWFLQIETFDPHEPFFTQQHYKDLYPHDYDGRHFDWPPVSARSSETPEEVQHCRYEYAALVSMCDDYLGKVLDPMDELDLWKDTMLIVNTDHGFLLGEHDWWAKCVQPFYDEVAHTPLFIWDPRSGVRGERRQALVQTIDLPPTLLEYFGMRCRRTCRGYRCASTIADDTPVREAGLFGLHGGQVNVTDGRYVYMRGPATRRKQAALRVHADAGAHAHTFDVEELQDIRLAEPFPFTKGCRTMKIEGRNWPGLSGPIFDTLLFDLQADPGQEHPIQDPAVEARMVEHLVRLMKENDAPPEQFERLGLEE